MKLTGYPDSILSGLPVEGLEMVPISLYPNIGKVSPRGYTLCVPGFVSVTKHTGSHTSKSKTSLPNKVAASEYIGVAAPCYYVRLTMTEPPV